LHGASQIAFAFPRKSFQQVPSANPTAGKPRSFLHHVENCVFSLAGDYGQAAHIDQQFASVQVSTRISPGGEKFGYPRFAEFSFDNQLALRSGIDDGNPKHLSRYASDIARRMPKLKEP
jgi:hypothetical protein